MKVLLAFALLAAASAMPEHRLLQPVQLEEPVYAPIDFAPLMVPQEVMDEVALKVKVVESPEFAEASEDINAYAVNFVEEAVNAEALAVEASEDVNDYAVNFVEEAVNAEAPAIEASEAVNDYAVNFVEEAVNAEPAAVEASENVQVSAVKVVEEPVLAEAPAVEAIEDVNAYAVNFVDEAADVVAPIEIQIMQIPLPGSVVMPLDGLVVPSIDAVQVVDSPVEASDDGLAVKFVDFAEPADEETPSFVPIKQYPDPRWR